MAARTVIVSPHLDDAVLSCWHLLGGGTDVTVVNVFTAVPEEGTLGWWDRLTGAVDSVERMRARHAEDEAALGRTGVRRVNLDLLDSQYRQNGKAPPVREALAPHVREAAAVYAPAALLPLVEDHAVVRNAAVGLRDDIRLYADLPHAALYGFPKWVTGEEEALEVGRAWDSRLGEIGFGGDAGRAQVHALSEKAFREKLDATRRYRTQLSALEHEASLEVLRWEVTWRR
jgi:hypothetical protein